jgi:hypothetical protein
LILPLQILGIQQVAIGCEEKSPLDALWKDIFGFQASASKRLEKENVEEDILKVGPSPFEVEVDLMVPIDKDKSPKVSISASDDLFLLSICNHNKLISCFLPTTIYIYIIYMPSRSTFRHSITLACGWTTWNVPWIG